MAAFNNVNIKDLNQIEEVADGNLLIIENDNGTNVIDFKDFVIGPNNASFYTEITSLSNNVASLSSAVSNAQSITNRQIRTSSSISNNLVFESVHSLANITDWVTLKTITPSATTGVYVRGIVESYLCGAAGTSSGVVSNAWQIDINNSTFSSAYINPLGTAAATLSSGALPRFRVLVSGSNFLVQAQSSAGLTTPFNGLAYLKMYLPSGISAGTSNGVSWTVT